MHTSLVSVLAGVVPSGWGHGAGQSQQARLNITYGPGQLVRLSQTVTGVCTVIMGVTESELSKSDSLPQVTTTLENHRHVESSAL